MLRRPILCLFFLLTVLASAVAQTPDAGNIQQDPAYLALSTSSVYVEPGINGIDGQVLQQAASQGQDDPHTPVKIAILASLPPAYAVRGREYYTFTLHQALGLDKSPLVLVVLAGPHPGVSLWTTALDAPERKRLERQYAQAIHTNPQAGTAALAQAAASDINGKEYRGTPMILWIVFLLVILAVGGLIWTAGRQKKQTMAVSLGPLTALRENVLRGIEYLDGYIDVLPKNNRDSEQTRAFRQAASAKYEQAAKILDRATEMTDLGRAQTLLDQAQADVQSARQALDRATGGTANIPGDDALRPPPLPASQPQVDAIPANQRGVSFFSGRPAPVGSLVPVMMTVGGQSRQVLATPEEAAMLAQGRMPEVLAFQQGGSSVPWYAYGSYDPYRDYWRYENAGWGGLGGGLVAGFIGAELLGDLMMPAYGMGGYSPYAFAPDTGGYQGYADPGMDNYNTPGFDPADQGAGDFSTDNSGGYDADNYDSGGDFSSGGDFGGGGDSGGGDFS